VVVVFCPETVKLLATFVQNTVHERELALL